MVKSFFRGSSWNSTIDFPLIKQRFEVMHTVGFYLKNKKKGN
jgi:hypothetical protein